MNKHIGILTSGGDCPGLNAAIRGVGKAAQGAFGMHVVGFRDGFRGLMENRTVALDQAALSGILTIGGTILGTSRDKPRRMLVGGEEIDATEAILANYEPVGRLDLPGRRRHAKERALSKGERPQRHHLAQNHR